MTVSMIKMVLEIPDSESLKDKRKVIKSLKDKIHRRFKVSVSEVDLLDSLSFSEIGIALVSNNKAFGESVMNKILGFTEDNFPGRVQDAQVYSQDF